MTTITVPPDVARITEGLRDTGYDFNTAVADIIDNSIAAHATKVDVRLGVDFGGNILLSVGDNGDGMDRDGLIEAMKYGSKRRPSAKSLGKFGLGLKTASTAFCQRLSVISRPSAKTEALRASWDLQYIASTNSWSLEMAPAEPTELQLLDEVAANSAGTLVLWEKVDRLLDGYKDYSGQHFRRAMGRLESALKDHLALVYQRFLDTGDAREKNIEIRVNGYVICGWDPFCLIETKSPVAEHVQEVELANGRRASFTVRAFILPRKEEFKSDDARNAAKISNERQGVYVYRENRLIHGPDWLGMYKQEPHFSLLRVELTFDHQLDDGFQVDIKKSRILLDENLFEWLRDKFLSGPRRAAETRYRRGAASVANGAAALLHTPASNVIHQKSAALSTANVSVVDANSNAVQISNKTGTTSTTIRIVASDDKGPIHVTTSDSLENGVLWEPVIGKGRSAAVALNTGHPFYIKAYLPNKANSTIVQALDYLLWALANAELNNINDETKEAFEEYRVEVSRNLKKLVADLPDATNQLDL